MFKVLFFYSEFLYRVGLAMIACGLYEINNTYDMKFQLLYMMHSEIASHTNYTSNNLEKLIVNLQIMTGRELPRPWLYTASFQEHVGGSPCVCVCMYG